MRKQDRENHLRGEAGGLQAVGCRGARRAAELAVADRRFALQTCGVGPVTYREDGTEERWTTITSNRCGRAARRGGCCAPIALPGVSDVTIPVAEFARMRVDTDRVFITENEINYVAFPDHPRALVIFGSGSEAPELLGALPWLNQVDVHYWGDIDTHGFFILDRLRAVLQHTRSLLMDRETLVAQRELWVTETTQANRDLPRLTDDEADVYGALCNGTLGPRVRLEQERIGFQYLERAFAQLRA